MVLCWKNKLSQPENILFSDDLAQIQTAAQQKNVGAAAQPGIRKMRCGPQGSQCSGNGKRWNMEGNPDTADFQKPPQTQQKVQ